MLGTRGARLLAERLPFYVPEVWNWRSQLHVAAEAFEAGAVGQALVDEVNVVLDRLAGRGRADVEPLAVAALPADDVDAHGRGLTASSRRRGCATSTGA